MSEKANDGEGMQPVAWKHKDHDGVMSNDIKATWEGSMPSHVKDYTIPLVALPDGYVIVPREPNDVMQLVGAQAIRIETTPLNKMWTANKVWREMIAASEEK